MKVTKVNKARKAIPEAGIKVGDTYYWWKFRYGGKRYSKTYPKRQQLTQSSYYAAVFDIEDRIGELHKMSTADDLKSEIESIMDDIESLRDEQEEKLMSMPDHLQETSSSGQLLQERIDALESAYSEFESIDLDYDEPSEEELREEALGLTGVDEEDIEEEEVDEGEVNGRIEELRSDKLAEWLREKVDETQNISLS